MADGTVRMTLEGFEGLDEELKSLPMSQARGVVMRTLRGVAKPTLDAALEAVPVKSGQMKKSLAVGLKLNARERKKHKREPGAVEVYIGSTMSHAHIVEFGSQNNPPQPFLRPAWESTKDDMLERLKDALWKNIRDRKTKNAKAAEKAAAAAAAAGE